MTVAKKKVAAQSKPKPVEKAQAPTPFAAKPSPVAKAFHGAPESRAEGPVETVYEALPAPVPVVKVATVTCRYCGTVIPKPVGNTTWYQCDACVGTGTIATDRFGKLIVTR